MLLDEGCEICPTPHLQYSVPSTDSAGNNGYELPDKNECDSPEATGMT